MRKFNDALRTTQANVERATIGGSGIASMFVKAGATIAGTLTAIAGSTVGLMDSVAQTDLGFQIFARRMFMSTEAARRLKMATDALGYSLEDVIWGPPELRQRMADLLKLQERLGLVTGGDFEAQMRKIRDVRFEFTKLGVTLRYLGMEVVKDLSKALFGDENALLSRLQTFNDWLVKNLPSIAEQISQKLAPILKDMGSILQNVWDVVKQIDLKRIADDLVWLSDKLKAFSDLVVKSPILQKMLLGGAVGEVVGGPAGAAVGALGAGAYGILSKDLDKLKVQNEVARVAKSLGLPVEMAEAVVEKESGFQWPKKTGPAGEIGWTQVTPPVYGPSGMNPNDPAQNLYIGLSHLRDLYQKFGGDAKRAFEAYNGSGPMARAYSEDVYNRMLRWKIQQGMLGINVEGWLGNRNPDVYKRMDPQSLEPMKGSWYNRSGRWEKSPDPISLKQERPAVDVGGITIHINQPNATPEQVKQAVLEVVEEKLGKQVQRGLLQRTGVFS